MLRLTRYSKACNILNTRFVFTVKESDIEYPRELKGVRPGRLLKEERLAALEGAKRYRWMRDGKFSKTQQNFDDAFFPNIKHDFRRSLEIFNEMDYTSKQQPQKIQLRDEHYDGVLEACAIGEQWGIVGKLLEEFRKLENRPVITFYSLIRKCKETKNLPLANQLFDAMKLHYDVDNIKPKTINNNEEPSPTEIRISGAYGDYIGVLSYCGDRQKALEKYKEMQNLQLHLSPYTLACVFDACRDGELNLAIKLFDEYSATKRRITKDMYVNLILAHIKTGSSKSVERIFDRYVLSGEVMSNIAFTAALYVFQREKKWAELLQFYEKNHESIRLVDEYTMNIVKNAGRSKVFSENEMGKHKRKEIYPYKVEIKKSKK